MAYRSSQARVRAVVATVDDGGVETSEELEVAAARPRLHHVESILDAKLGNGIAVPSTQAHAQRREVNKSSLYRGVASFEKDVLRGEKQRKRAFRGGEVEVAACRFRFDHFEIVLDCANERDVTSCTTQILPTELRR